MMTAGFGKAVGTRRSKRCLTVKRTHLMPRQIGSCEQICDEQKGSDARGERFMYRNTRVAPGHVKCLQATNMNHYSRLAYDDSSPDIFFGAVYCCEGMIQNPFLLGEHVTHLYHFVSIGNFFERPF